MNHLDNKVYFYEREYYVFSNFSSFAIDWKGFRYMTSEHAYHTEKFLDKEIVKEIQKAPSAHDSFKIARKYADKVREDWIDIRIEIMEQILRVKVSQHPYVLKKLLETGSSEIIEDSPVDSFWGWGPDKNGENQLGKLWMKIREDLKG